MNEHLEYKGYWESAQYCKQDGVFHRKIEGICDLIMFEGESMDRLKHAFADAVWLL
jgi:predicted HicB family RNase H-like nuclease